MITFVDIVLLFFLYGAFQEYRKLMNNPLKSIESMIAVTIILTVTMASCIYVTGWLVVPSWGFGSINRTCF